ncbi:MAG: energy-coupling factor transporter ATPase [Oscillospiraceae bacterium]
MFDDIIKAEDVYFSYSSTDDKNAAFAVNGVTMNIHKGQFTAILGRNGSGKSTIAKHFNAILVADRGTVTVNGMDTADEDNLFAIRQFAGMVFQNPDNQIVSSVVEEDVAFALENLGVEPSEIRKRVDDALKAVSMYEYRLHSPNQLSGGQKQRIAIAGIIAMRPECIILDEPTAMLDPQGRKEVLDIIQRLNRDYGITAVLITHYMDEASKADRIIVMDNGKVIMDDIPKNIFSEVERVKSAGLDVPQVTELVYELNKCGFNLDKHIISEDECIEALEKMLKSM